jgi:putative endopeptidase
LANPDVVYNKYAFSSLDVEFPGIPWYVIAKGVGMTSQEIGDVVLDSTIFFSSLGPALQSLDIDTLKDYILKDTLVCAIPYLSKVFIDTHFAFVGKVLYGLQTQSPRWKKAVSSTTILGIC